MVQQVEDAVEPGRPYDYVLVCVKVIPELYELADVIADVVTPSHTCILLNTTTTIGVEKSLGRRFPKNLIVSLVNYADLNQTAAFEFEHLGQSARVWIGTAIRNEHIPEETQQDMVESLALTLEAGSVDCQISHNIIQQQWEKMMGYIPSPTLTDSRPIAFHTLSVISQEPNFKALEQDPYSSRILRSLLAECIQVATRQHCEFSKSHVLDVIAQMIAPFPIPNDNEPLDTNLLTTMYQDLLANRPLEFEVYLGNPVRMAEDEGIAVPNLRMLYAIARHVNKARTKADGARSPHIPQPRQLNVPPPPRQSMVNGRGRGLAPRSFSDGPPTQPNGRGRPIVNGHPPTRLPRRGSFEGDLDQFRDIAMYADNIASNENIDPKSTTNGDMDFGPRGRPQVPSSRHSELDIRSRELQIRERELQLREREIEMQRRGRLRHNNVPSTIVDDEDEDDGPVQGPGSQRQVMVNETFDMMSVTGRKARNKSLPSNTQIRKTPFMGGDPNPSGGGRLMSLTGGRSKSRAGSSLGVSHATFDPLNENPLMGFTSNRYPGVDTRSIVASSRANSLTSQRMDELGMGPGRTASMMGPGGAYPSISRGPPPRGSSIPQQYGRGRPPPPPQEYAPQGMSRGYQDPASLSAPGIPPKDPSKVRSTTGSASASSASLGGTGESHSSSSSLEPPGHHVRI